MVILFQMELDPKFNFVSSGGEYSMFDKSTEGLLIKWGLKENLVIQHFSFDEPFQQYHKYRLAEAFFKDNTIAKELLTPSSNGWVKQGKKASSVEVKHIPCSVLNLSFFDDLHNPENGIVHPSGTICKRLDAEIDGYLVSDNLRAMLLDEGSPEYNLYSNDMRQEFIFRIFQMLVLGGVLCQYEDTLQPYLDVTKKIYKSLSRVEKQKYTDDLSVSTIVLEVVAKDCRNEAYFPYGPNNLQNIGFLIIDPNLRNVTTFLHQFSGNYLC